MSNKLIECFRCGYSRAQCACPPPARVIPDYEDSADAVACGGGGAGGFMLSISGGSGGSIVPAGGAGGSSASRPIQPTQPLGVKPLVKQPDIHNIVRSNQFRVMCKELEGLDALIHTWSPPRDENSPASFKFYIEENPSLVHSIETLVVREDVARVMVEILNGQSECIMLGEHNARFKSWYVDNLSYANREPLTATVQLEITWMRWKFFAPGDFETTVSMAAEEAGRQVDWLELCKQDREYD